MLAGAWNPAIFQSGWVARHLYGVPQGEEIAGREVIEFGLGGRRILYFNEVGVNASQERVEIFLNSLDADACALAENVVTRLLKTLPHTPVVGFGINYHFVLDNPESDLLDKLRTRDGIDEHFKILKENFISSIEIDEAVVLNFSRKPAPERVEFDFNYHRSKVSSQIVNEMTEGRTKSFLERSCEILQTLYAVSGYELLRHDFDNGGEGDDQ